MEFWTRQLDFLFGVQGLAFVVLASGNWVLARRERIRQPWNWFGFAAFFWGICQWQDLISWSSGDGQQYYLVRLILSGISWFSLLEFSRRAAILVGKKPVGLWIHCVFGAAAFSGAIFGPGHLDLTWHFGLAVPVGVWTVFTLGRLWKTQQPAHSALGWAASAFALYVLFCAVEVPISPYVEGVRTLWNRSFGWSLALRYLSTGAAVVFTTSMWKFLRFSFFSDIRVRNILPYEKAIVWSVPMILVCGWLATAYSEKIVLRNAREHLLEAVEIVASDSVWARSQSLSATIADLRNPDYRQLKRRLASVRNSISHGRFVYLMRREGDEIRFLADSEPETSPDMSPPGQVYVEAPPEIRPLFDRWGRVSTRYEDRWGRFDSGFVSIADDAVGRIVAVLGIDIEASRFDAMARDARLLPLVITILFGGLVVTFFMAQQHDARAKWLLAQAEESLTALLDNIPETACLVDIRGRVLQSNREMGHRELRGQTGDFQANLLELVPGFRDFWTSDDWEGVKAGHPGRFMVRRDDREIDYRVYPVLDEYCRVSRLAILGLDITDRLRVEAALREGEQRFKDIALSSADWLWEIDADGQYTFASGRVEDVLGYKPEEVLGKTPFDFMAPEEAERVRKIFLEIGGLRAPIVDLENRCWHKDGHEVYLLTSGTPIFSENGSFLGYRGVDKDITAKYLADKFLRESEERFRAIAENSPDVIMRFDREGRHLYVSPAVTAMAGMTPDEFIGNTHREMEFPEDLCVLWENAIQRTFAQGRVERREFVLPSGIVVDWLLVPEFDSDGHVAFVISSARDISELKTAENKLKSMLDHLEQLVEERTAALSLLNVSLEAEVVERRRVEAALRRSEERFRALVETTNDWIFEINTLGEFTYNSPQVEQILGYAPDELVGKVFEMLLSPDEARRVRQHFESTLSVGGSLKGFEWVAISRDGRSVTFETNADPYYDEGGLIRGFRGIHRDVSERKVAENSLRDSEAKFRQLFEGITDALFVHEIRHDGSPGRFVEVNDEACRRLGYTRDELLKMNPRDIDAPPPDGVELTPIGQQLWSGKFLTFYQTHMTKDGRHIPVEISAHVFDFAGRSMVMSMVRDVSERRAAERALRESEERFRLLTEESLTGVFLQSGGNLTYSNRRLAQMLGYRPEDIPRKLGTQVLEFVHPDDREEVRANLETREQGGNAPHEYECRMVSSEGKPVWVTMLVTGIHHNGVPSTVGHVIDVTERKRGEERLRFLSYHDPQTGLRNRTFFEDLMEKMSDEALDSHPLTIVVADIDGLKVVNDTFGHRAGDEHIVTIARILADSFNGETEICRVGGDEFCIVMPKTPIEEASRRVVGVLDRVKRFNARSPRIPISVSIGHSTSHSSHESVFEIYQRADDNMYQYKLTQIESPKSRVIDILLMALAERDFVLQGHVERMVRMVSRMAELVGLPEHRKRDLILFARIHDLGKVGIPDEILFKPSALTPEEFSKIKLHVQIGHKIASRSRELAHIATLVLHHHEFWDGNGYPNRLRGEEIPLECRILAIVDAYDAMTQTRPYSAGRSTDEAISELSRCSGRQFDPRLVEVFLDMIKTLPPIAMPLSTEAEN